MRLVNIVIVSLAMLFALNANARVWTVNDLPMDYLQDERRHVCNPDGVLSPQMTDSLDAVLYTFEKSKGVQCIVVAVKQLEEGDTYTFGMELGRKYGIGRKDKNTGLVIVLSTDDRRYSILTGLGLEGTLPDAICKRIENRIMVPYFKKGDWDNGMMRAVAAINGYINGDTTLDGSDDKESSWWGFPLLFFFIIVFVVVITYSSARKCPQCGRKSLAKSAEKFLYTRDGWDYFQVISSCRRCGYSESSVVRRRHEDNDNGGLLAGAIIGSMLSGRGGGGGFSGGSFGGGSFGGGGASGDF